MEQILKYIKGDRPIWLIMLILSVASLLLVYSSVVTLAYRHHDGNTLYYLFRHGFILVCGMGLMFLAHKVKYTYYSKIAQPGAISEYSTLASYFIDWNKPE